LPPTQSSLKKQNGEFSLTLYTNGFFASVLMSPIQMGSLSVNNSVTNFSRLGTFNLSFLTAFVTVYGFKHFFIKRGRTTMKQCLAYFQGSMSMCPQQFFIDHASLDETSLIIHPLVVTSLDETSVG
jgi:hypothetical protein